MFVYADSLDNIENMRANSTVVYIGVHRKYSIIIHEYAISFSVLQDQSQLFTDGLQNGFYCEMLSWSSKQRLLPANKSLSWKGEPLEADG